MIAADTNHESTDNTTVSKSAAKVIEDVVVLVELHGQLFLDDGRQYALEIVPLVGTFAAAAMLLLAALAMGLAAIALKLISEGMPPAQACGLVALATIIAAAAFLAWGRKRLQTMSGPFVRSRTEFAKNIAWIKTRL
jgi:hypothetical protein